LTEDTDWLKLSLTVFAGILAFVIMGFMVNFVSVLGDETCAITKTCCDIGWYGWCVFP